MTSTILRLVLIVLTAWLDCREREAIAHLVEENRLLRRQVADVDCVSLTKIAVAWPSERTESAVPL